MGRDGAGGVDYVFVDVAFFWQLRSFEGASGRRDGRVNVGAQRPMEVMPPRMRRRSVGWRRR